MATEFCSQPWAGPTKKMPLVWWDVNEVAEKEVLLNYGSVFYLLIMYGVSTRYAVLIIERLENK